MRGNPGPDTARLSAEDKFQFLTVLAVPSTAWLGIGREYLAHMSSGLAPCVGQPWGQIFMCQE